MRVLCRRYKKAKADFEVAETELKHLNDTIDNALLAEWTKQEHFAHLHRSRDVKVMDIYDVQENTGNPEHMSDTSSCLYIVIYSSRSCPISIQLDGTRVRGRSKSRCRLMAG